VRYPSGDLAVAWRPMPGRVATRGENPRGRALTAAAACGPPVVIASVFAAMLAFSWGKWPDVLVDFGHELYTPWLLSQGRVLGRDVVMAATGPLSPYLNAMLFRIFGPGAWVLFAFNLVVLGGLTWLLFVLLREIGDRFSATLSCVLFLTVFAFGQYVGIGNFNFVAPYSHGVTHGMFLSLAALALTWRHARTGSRWSLGGASLLLGLVFLTKPEFTIACGGALGAAFLLILRDASSARRRIALWAAAVLPALAVPIVSFALLALGATPLDGWRATLGPWLAMGTPLTKTPFYLAGLGMDDPSGNAVRALAWFAGYAGLVLAIGLLDWRARSAPARWGAAVLVSGGLILAAWACVASHALFDVARPLPIVAFLGFVASAVLAWRAPRPCPPRALLQLALATFALLLLAKMALNARWFHYGFALAMPATLVAFTWLAASAPRLVQRWGGSGLVLRVSSLAILVALAGSYLRYGYEIYAYKTERVGAGADAFLADGRGRFVTAILDRLAKDGEPGATLAVIPEGVMINYLARRESPSPILAYMPDAIALFGEDALLAPLQARPPRYVVIAWRDATEHGARLFGRDYGFKILRFLEERYEPVGAVGGSPFNPDEYGMLLLRSRGGARPRADAR